MSGINLLDGPIETVDALKDAIGHKRLRQLVVRGDGHTVPYFRTALRSVLEGTDIEVEGAIVDDLAAELAVETN